MQRPRLAHRLILLLGALTLMLAPGCADTTRDDISLATALLNPGGLAAQKVQAAIGPDGSHHLLYEETDGVSSRLVYAYQKSSEAPHLATLSPDANSTDFRNPDIAVTDGGRVYLAWHRRALSDGKDYVCWASFTSPPAIFRIPACRQVGSDPTSVDEAPLLAVYQNTVYLIFTYLTGAVHNLAALRLNPAAESYDDLYTLPKDNVYYLGVDGQVGQDGMLHTAFWVSANGEQRVKYVRYAPDGGRSEYAAFAANGVDIQGPALAIDRPSGEEDVVYYVFNTKSNATGATQMRAFYRENTASSEDQPTAVSPLDDADHWDFSGRPAITTIYGLAYVFFTGREQVPDDRYDIWSVTVPTSGSSVLTNRTSSALQESRPYAATVTQNGLQGPVVFFRQEVGLGRYRDAFAYDNAKDLDGHRIRQIYAGPGEVANSSCDLAAREDHVLAAWIDVVSGDNPRQVPWIAYNGEFSLAYLPMIGK